MSDRTSITVYDEELEVIKQAKRDLEYRYDRDLSLHEALTEFAARHLNGQTCADCGKALNEGGYWMTPPGDVQREGYERGARICHDCADMPPRDKLTIE